ncbi:unnamed protein product [Lathyrus sativus]|nr:unnamed protein product [Lathyrus sativus]
MVIFVDVRIGHVTSCFGHSVVRTRLGFGTSFTSISAGWKGLRGSVLSWRWNCESCFINFVQDGSYKSFEIR